MIAEGLARIYGIKSQYWLDMQASYDAKKKLDRMNSD
jgi:plasmid maintenance system antidote protein VapI